MINYLLEASLCMAGFYLVYRLFLHLDTAFARNRAYLLASLAASLLIPLVSYQTRSATLPLEVTTLLQPVVVGAGQTVVENSQGTNLLQWLVWLYSAGVLIALCRLVSGLHSLNKLVNAASREQRFGVTLVWCPPGSGSFSFMNHVFIERGTDLHSHAARHIIQHELAHIRQKHSYDLLFASLLKVFFWCNPLVYLFERELVLQHEYLADRAALAGNNHDEYTSLMVETAIGHTGKTLCHSFNYSPLKKRITMIYKKPSSAASHFKILFALPLAMLMLLVFSCEQQQDLELLENQQKSKKLDMVEMETGEDFFYIVEQTAVPRDGMQAFYRYLGEEMEYPALAKDEGVEGKVYLQLIIGKDGGVEDIKALRVNISGTEKSQADVPESIGESFEREAIAAVRAYGNWEPARQRGQNVKQRIVMPVAFKLN